MSKGEVRSKHPGEPRPPRASDRRGHPAAPRVPQGVINDLLRCGIEETIHARAAHGGQRGWREKDDELCRLVDHVGRLDRRQRRGHPGGCPPRHELPGDARLLQRRLLRRFPQARLGRMVRVTLRISCMAKCFDGADTGSWARLT